MKRLFLSALFLLGVLNITCAAIKVKVSNPLPEKRVSETVELPWSNIIKKDKKISAQQVVVIDSKGAVIPSQVVYEGNLEPQMLIFQVSLDGNSSEKYTVQNGTPGAYTSQAYGRFVPERKDDYAWENNVIAFRIYGPALESELVSCGIDVWCKRTPNLIINKWYAEDDYHNDKGEGCDVYKVGPTLGCGASAPYVDGKLWFGRNYASWKNLDNGPIRTTARFSYAAFDAAGRQVTLEKTISLDANSRFNKVTDVYSGDFGVMPVAAGIVLHRDARTVCKGNFIAVTEPASDSKTGKDGDISLAVIMQGMQQAEAAENLVCVRDVAAGKPSVYYFGAGWSKYGVENHDDWKHLVEKQTAAVENPLTVSW